MLRVVFLLVWLATPAYAGTMLEGKKVCVTGGCSSQLCVDAKQGDAVSTCEWAPAYGCYQQYGTCEVQPGGECGWTPTQALTDCLANPPAIISPSVEGEQ